MTYRSEVVGSLLRPTYLVEARKQFESGQLSAAPFKAMEDQAVPFHFSRTGSEADTLAELTLKDEPVTVTWSPALPAVLDRLRVARLVHANAAAPAMTDAAAAAPNTVVTFLRRFML